MGYRTAYNVVIPQDSVPNIKFLECNPGYISLSWSKLDNFVPGFQLIPKNGTDSPEHWLITRAEDHQHNAPLAWSSSGTLHTLLQIDSVVDVWQNSVRLCLITFHSWKKICRGLPTIGAGNFCTRPASYFFWFTPYAKPTRWNFELTPRNRFLEGELICWADMVTHKSEMMKCSPRVP